MIDDVGAFRIDVEIENPLLPGARALADDSEYGKFGWVMDPEGNKVELWQPPGGQ